MRLATIAVDMADPRRVLAKVRLATIVADIVDLRRVLAKVRLTSIVGVADKANRPPKEDPSKGEAGHHCSGYSGPSSQGGS